MPTGALKIRDPVSGQWVLANAAPATIPNEVAIQAATPGVDTELWYDTANQILKARTSPTTFVNIVSPVASGTLDGLLDVDTTTITPVADNLLVYNQPTSTWRPRNGATMFLPLTGGTLSGSLTAQGFTGSGSGLTNLNASEITSGILSATRLPTTITADTTGSAGKLATARSIGLTGDVTGSALFDGSANATITAIIAANSVALGSDTTGNYTASVTGTPNQVIVNGVTGEGSAYTLQTPQDIHVLAQPTFDRLTLSQVSGLPPMTIQSTTRVPNLNADRLDDQEGDFYREWANLLSKPDPTISINLTGPVQGSDSKLWTDLNGNLAFSIATTMPGGAGSNIDADKLDGFDSTYFMDAASLTSGYISSGRLTGTYTINIIGSVTGPVIGNADTATKLLTPRLIAGKTFDGTQDVVLSTHTRGTYLTGSNYTGAAAVTWAVDATSANTVSKVVARDAAGDFFANVVNVSRLASTVITGTPPLSVISTTLVPNLNVQFLQGREPSYFATREEVEALLGDLRLVGAYDAASYTGSWVSMPPSKLLARMSGEPLMLDAHNIVTYANMIANSTFQGTAVGGVAPGWTVLSFGTVTSPTQTLYTSVTHGAIRAGEQMQRFTGTYDDGDYRVLQPNTAPFATVPGATYRITLVAKSSPTTPGTIHYKPTFQWSSDVAGLNDVTLSEFFISGNNTYYNTYVVTATAPAVGGNFCMPSIRVAGAPGTVAVALNADILRFEFSQSPEIKNTGQAGNAVMMGGNMPVLHPEPDDSYFWFPGAVSNNLSWSHPGTTADPSLDWRCRCRWDGHSGRVTRVWDAGLFISFQNNAVTVGFLASDATSIQATMTTASSSLLPLPGEWVDLRGVWDATTDTLTLYWKAADFGSLLDSTGWTSGATLVSAGKMMDSAARTYTHGTAVTGGYHYKGAIKHVALYVNGVLDTNIDARALTDPSVASFVAATGQTINITRSGGLPTQLIPSRFYDGRSVALLNTGNYLSVPDHPGLNFSGTESMTVLLTLRQSSAPTAFGRYLYKYGPAGATPGYMISPSSPVTTQRATVETPTVSNSTRTLAAAADRKKKTWGMRIDRSVEQLTLIEDGILATPAAITPAAATLVNTGALTFAVGANATANPATYEFMSALVVRQALSATDLAEYNAAADRGSDLYQHATYWVCSSPGTLDYIDSDWSLRYEITDDDTVTVFNGDWILCFDPHFNEPGHGVGTWHPRQEMVFQYVPFSAETYVKSQISDHVSKADPHDQYVLWAEGVTAFAPFSHDHPDEIATAITAHESLPDPHAQYLREIEASALYMPIGKTFNAEILDAVRVHEEKTDPHSQYLLPTEGDARYETIGSVTSHEAKADPHPIYLTASEGDSRYDVAGKIAEHEAKPDPHPQYLNQIEGLSLFASLVHYHDDRYYSKTEVDGLFNIRVEDEVTAADVAQSARWWLGGLVKPTVGQGLAVGDCWLESPAANQLVPGAVAGFSFAATSPTSITLNWSSWPVAATITSINLESSPDGSVWTAVASPPATNAISYLDTTSLTENMVRRYRIRANNALGAGPWSTTLVANAANAAPNPPTALAGSGATPTTLVLTWTAPTWSDPGPSGARYEMFLNGVSVGFAATTAVTYTFTGLTENTQYTLGVRSKDAGGMTSSLVTLNSTATKTTNAAPANVPTGVTAGASTTLPSVTVSWTAPTLPADFLNYEVQVVQVSGSVVLQTKTTTSLTSTFDDVAWGTPVFGRVRVMDVLGAGSAYANSTNVTTMANPAVTMGTPTVTATDITITWTAPVAQVADFTGYTLNEYDGPSGTTVLRTFAKSTALTHTFTAMPYGVSKRYAVLETRSGSLAPVVSAYSAAATTIADPIPTSLAVSASGNVVTATWSPPAVVPADATVYRIRLYQGASLSTETTVAYNATRSASFSGLAYATAFSVEVRLERTNTQHSSYTAKGSATTGPNPDTTPPGNAYISAFKPFNNYGEMHIQGTWPSEADFATARVWRIISGGNWEVIWYSGASPSANFSIYCGGLGSGQYMEIAIDVIDARGNERRVPHVGYTLAASPTYVYADATNYWRNTNGGQYNPDGTYRLVQGYYSTASYNAVAYIYYGYKIANACAGKTVYAMHMYLHREGGGYNAADVITTYIHNEVSSPGTVAYIGGNAWIGGTAHDWGTLTYGQAAWAPLSAEQVYNLSIGYRGIALWRSSGKPYMLLYALSANTTQGCIAVYHLG